MKLHLIIMCLGVIFFQIVEAQRGGGSSHSHSSSSHSSSRSRSNYHFRSYYPSPQTSQIDYATNLWDDLHMLIIILGSFIGIGVSAALISNYLENKRMKHQWQLFKSGQSIRNQIIDIDSMIQKIKEQNWRMEYKIDVESDNEPHLVQIFSIEISNKKEQIQDELELHLKGNDSVGSWEGNGIIKFSEPILLQFKKEYLNKEQAGQTGKWKNLIYEGIFQEQKQLFIGKWYYLGLEKDQQFSGVWQIQLIEK